MRINSIWFLLVLAACIASLTPRLRADDGVEGGDIQGSESVDQEIVMTPTAAAPTGSTMELSLEAQDDQGSTTADLKLEGSGFFAGTYLVSATLKSDGSSLSLGNFSVDSEGEAEIEFGGEATPFPANLNPLDIATVSILDSNLVIIFTANLNQISGSSVATRTATVQALPGSTDPNATGTAVLNAVFSGGQAKGSLQLIGHGLPAKLQLAVKVNGILSNVKKITTDKGGNVSVNIGPKGKAGTVATGVTLFQVNSIQLSDRFGNALLSAGF